MAQLPSLPNNPVVGDPRLVAQLIANDEALRTAANTIDTAQLAADSITTAKILDANVTTAKLADDVVTTAKILDANVTAAKIAGSSLGWDKTALDGGGLLAEACSVLGAGQSIAAIGPTILDFGSASFDTSGRFNLSTNRFQPLVKGVYDLRASVMGTYSGANTRLTLALQKNGTEVASQVGHDNAGYGTSVRMAEVSRLVPMNGSSDYVQVAVTHYDTLNITYSAANVVFEAYLLGRQA